MGEIKPILLAVATAVLAGCVSPTVTAPASAAVDFYQFHKVRLIVKDSAKTAYSKERLPMVDGLLKGRLQSLGFTLFDANPEMVVEVTVHQFDPGNRVLRWVIGFGAGRASLKYTARFEYPNGKLLAELEGGKAYHGAEMNENTNFKSNESLCMGMISHSVSQIGEFIQNNGREKK